MNITDELVSKFIVFAREEGAVNELEAALLQLQALRTRLPRTKDGYPIIPGLCVHHQDDAWIVASITFNAKMDGDKMLLRLVQLHDPDGECTARGFQVFANEATAKAVQP